MMDFTPEKAPHGDWSEAFQAIIDAAMEAKQQAETPRNYLGASRLGEECDKMLAYKYNNTPKDEGGHFPGRILRVFDRGHDAETRFADYLRLAGFKLLTERPDGRQFGFAIAWDDGRGCFRISGHCDGVIIDGPAVVGGIEMKYPCLWEMKALGEKSWKDTVRKGVKSSKPVYYSQMQLYMNYLGLADNPGLFTALNGNDGNVYAELVPFDASNAQAASDRGARVVSGGDPENFPRIGKDATFFKCRFCNYAKRCWAEPAKPTTEANNAVKAWGWTE